MSVYINKRRLIAIDSETDPFKHNRIPKPFIWGAYDGENYFTFDRTATIVDFLKQNSYMAFAHNGGKFDFIYMLDDLDEGALNIINGRLVQAKLGKSILRDSFAIMPTPLSAYQKEEIDYALFEEDVRHKHMDVITAYLKSDVKYLYDMTKEYLATAGTRPTIASNAMGFAKKLGIEVGRTDKRFDAKFRPFYYGGRCQAFKKGKFKDVIVYDINSAYPFAMMHDHATGNQYREVRDIFALPPERAQRCFITLTCHSDGAFPRREKDGLSFPVGHGTYNVTGWEFVTALKHNLIAEVQIHECYEFYEDISFSDYVTHWYKVKADAEKDGNRELRYIAKIILNALYGKLCQDPERYCDYKIVPPGTSQDDGWIYCWEYENKEVHRRDAQHVRREKLGDDFDNAKLYYNVATGASITGFIRSMLLDAINTIGQRHVIYCDTDSIFMMKNENVLGIGDKLGDWTEEGYADELHIGGKKLYAARGKFGDKTEKIASKGSKLTFDEIAKVAGGGKVIWKNAAPSFKLDGTAKFVIRTIAATCR